MVSVAENFFSKQFDALRKDKSFDERELLNMAAIRQKVPSIEALSTIIQMARHPKMCIDLQIEIEIQGSISAARQMQHQQQIDLTTLREETEQKRKLYLKNVCDEFNAIYPDKCPFMEFHTNFCPSHNPDNCMACKAVANERIKVRHSYFGKDVTESSFMLDYYERSDIINFMTNIRKCKCCVKHQIRKTFYPTLDGEPRFESVYDYATGEETQQLMNPLPGEVIPCVSVYPVTAYQSTLPHSFHHMCDCSCCDMVSSLIVDVEEVELYLSKDEW